MAQMNFPHDVFRIRPAAAKWTRSRTFPDGGWPLSILNAVCETTTACHRSIITHILLIARIPSVVFLAGSWRNENNELA
jgi:hypothetical protein